MTKVIVSMSGGKDSTATALLAKSKALMRYTRLQTRAMSIKRHTNTLNTWKVF